MADSSFLVLVLTLAVFVAMGALVVGGIPLAVLMPFVFIGVVFLVRTANRCGRILDATRSTNQLLQALLERNRLENSNDDYNRR
jgi:hypothetical protein